MELLEHIHENYRCETDNNLSNELRKELDGVCFFKNLEENLIGKVSDFLGEKVYFWKPVEPSCAEKPGLINKNKNYILITKDYKIEVHVLIYLGKVKRVNSWNLFKK